MKTTPELVNKLEPNQIFVFGSNLRGKHGLGAAYTAKKLFNAQESVGKGFTGRSYAVPTKDVYLKPLSLTEIQENVNQLYTDIVNNPKLEFIITKIGCGYAGYKIEQIKPMFSKFLELENVTLPKEFQNEEL